MRLQLNLFSRFFRKMSTISGLYKFDEVLYVSHKLSKINKQFQILCLFVQLVEQIKFFKYIIFD